MATVYVSPTGSDSYTYVQAQSSSTPWQTIGKCNTSATTGDTIVVMAGTHTLAGVTFTKSFTIQGQTEDESLYILDGAAASARWTLSLASGSLAISNVTFQNANNNAFFLISGAGASISWTNCVINVQYSSSATVAIFCGSSSSTCTFAFTNTLIMGVGANGTNRFLFYEANGATAVFTLNNCVIYVPAITDLFSAIGAITTTIKNTITYATGSTPYKTGTVTSTATYSDFYNITSSPAGTGNITSDPLFVDAANSNFNLRPTSPCIGTGSV